MIEYFLRCTDKKKLDSLAIKLGILAKDEEGNLRPVDCTWDEVGPIYVETGEKTTDEDGTETPVMAVKCDADGNPYHHVNLSMESSLGDIANAIYSKTKDKTLGLALKDMTAYFVTDDDGKPRRPANPSRVFF